MFILPIEDHEPKNSEQANPNGKQIFYIFLFVLFIFIAALFWILFLT